MTKEMRRPCVITYPVVVNDGKPFEAYGAYVGFGTYGDYCNFTNIILKYPNSEDLPKGIKQFARLGDGQDTYDSIVFQLAKALNPPIKVTQAVLDAMNKVPEASFWYVEGCVNVRLKWDDTLKTFTVNGQTLSVTDYIQADCPLALQVLLQFNEEGETHA